MSKRGLIGWLVGVLAVAGLLSPGAGLGAGPTFERIAVDDTFADEELAEECGVPVTTTVRGHVILREFSGEGQGLLAVNTLNLAITSTAGERTFRFRDVGGDLARVEPDGTAVLYITGQVPFEFAGVLKLDLETEEVFLEPRDRSEEQLARACRFLTGG